MNQLSARQELEEILFEKIPQILKTDERLLRENGVRNEVAKRSGINAVLGSVTGAGYGAAGGLLLHKSGYAALLGNIHPKLKGAGVGKIAALGGAVGGVMSIPTTIIEAKALKTRADGLKKYPKSKGEFGKPGWTDSYPEHSATKVLGAYFKKPTSFSAREELDTICFGKMEDEDRWYHKGGRVAVTAGIGGLAGRTLAWRPVTGGKMNRATAIGAGLGAVSQGIAEHIAGAKKGIHGNPVRVKDEARKDMREMGKAFPLLGLGAGAIAASVRSRKDTFDSVFEGLKFQDARQAAASTDPIKKAWGEREMGEIGSKIHARQMRAAGLDSGERFIPKMPQFARKAASSMGVGLPATVDETGGGLEEKLERLARREKGTPEGAAAARKLHELRDRQGKTVAGRVKNFIKSIPAKMGSFRRGKSPVGKVSGMLMSAREELNLILFADPYVRDSGGQFAGGVNPMPPSGQAMKIVYDPRKLRMPFPKEHGLLPLRRIIRR